MYGIIEIRYNKLCTNYEDKIVLWESWSRAHKNLLAMVGYEGFLYYNAPNENDFCIKKINKKTFDDIENYELLTERK